MLDLILYLLPLSGERVLRNLTEMKSVRIQTVLLPENFRENCNSLIAILEDETIPYRIPGDLTCERLKAWIRERNHHLGLSFGYDKKLPQWLIKNPEMSTINFHPSALPDYRGANPYFWVIRNREARTGVTAHFMDESMDTGPIIRREMVPIQPDETMGSLFFLLADIGARMSQELLEEILQDRSPPDSYPQPRNPELPRAPRVTQGHLRIDWNQPALSIEALVRAANPFFGAYTTFRGQKLRIFELEILDAEEWNGGVPSEDGEKKELSPGRLVTTPRGPAIRVEDGWVRPNVLEMDQLYRCSGKEFQRRESRALGVLERVI